MHEPRSAASARVSPEQVKKARMLVSMLGADFAKSSKHPFFKDLAKTAVRPLPARSTPPDMSAALAKLVKNLADPRVASRLRPAPPAEPQTPVHPSVEIEPAALDPDLSQQHPVLIAKQLVNLPKPERLAMLRKLPGQASRHVAAYLAELESAPKS